MRDEGPAVTPVCMEHGLGLGFEAPLVCDAGWEYDLGELLTWHWAHHFWHPGPSQGRSAHPHCTHSRKEPKGDNKSSSMTLCTTSYTPRRRDTGGDSRLQ